MQTSNTKTAQKESDPNRGLRLLVISMGVILVSGLILLFVLLALGVHKDKPIKVTSDCESELVLDPDEELTYMESDGRIAIVETETDSSEVIRHIDMCSGNVLRQLTIRQPDDAQFPLPVESLE